MAEVGLELYTVRDETARDFAGTVRKVAALGYPAVEFAGYGDLAAEELRDLLAETGLRAAATHVSLANLEADFDRELAYCRTIGCSTLILPWLPPEKRSPEFLAALAPQLNQFGRQARAAGITFGYHNHDFEFVLDEGQTLLARLLAATDPDLVALELDVYWAAYAGFDPIALLREYAGRAPVVHLKDMDSSRRYTEVGDGTLDIKAIAAAAKEGGTSWLIVEHDNPTMPSLESAKRSLENLRGLGIAR
ncbi:MAG TPA: sugar phosphate isomerase/epimerase [Chloroflexota bacterium]|nr:sugar phosphate isomerase/epimerase [Chloroflexota bacterium]